MLVVKENVVIINEVVFREQMRTTREIPTAKTNVSEVDIKCYRIHARKRNQLSPERTLSLKSEMPLCSTLFEEHFAFYNPF